MKSNSLKRDEDLLLVTAYNRVRAARIKLSNPGETFEAFYEQHPILRKAARIMPAVWECPENVWTLFKPVEQGKLATAADAIRQRWSA